MEFNLKKKRVLIEMSKGGHQLVKLEFVGEWSNERSMHNLETENVFNKSSIEKMHRVLNHKRVKKLEYAFRSAGKMSPGTAKMIKDLVEECDVRMSDFNAVVTMDFKEIGKVYILWMVCAFMKMIKGMSMKDKKAESIIENLSNRWYLNYGFQWLDFLQIMEESLETTKWKSL